MRVSGRAECRVFVSVVVFVALCGGCSSGHAGPDAGTCDSNPLAAGCPCDDPQQVACYEGPAETRDVGLCRDGLRSCSGEVWSECEGQVLPSTDVCDCEDNDCDGDVDEDEDPCKGCNWEPEHECYGRGAGCIGFSLEAKGLDGIVSCEGEPEDECLTLPAAPGTGSWTVTVSGCESVPNTWSELEFEADLPAGTSIAFQARSGEQGIDLLEAPWEPVGSAPPGESPFDLGLSGLLLQVRTELTATEDVAPKLYSVGVTYVWYY